MGWMPINAEGNPRELINARVAEGLLSFRFVSPVEE